MKIVEVDFGMGNIRSLQKAFEHLNQDVLVSSEAKDIDSADVLLLPGDGAFGKAIEEIKSLQLYDSILNFKESGKPILGICIGFQLFFSESEEFGKQKGFDFLDGCITSFDKTKLTVPHMGWSKTKILNNNHFLFKNIPDEVYFYYVHSFRLNGIHKNALATGNYGSEFTSIIEKDNIIGTQFHPEKSQKWGLKILENYISHL